MKAQSLTIYSKPVSFVVSVIVIEFCGNLEQCLSECFLTSTTQTDANFNRNKVEILRRRPRSPFVSSIVISQLAKPRGYLPRHVQGPSQKHRLCVHERFCHKSFIHILTAHARKWKQNCCYATINSSAALTSFHFKVAFLVEIETPQDEQLRHFSLQFDRVLSPCIRLKNVLL